MRSQSADDMCKIPSTRRRRFRQLLQTMIESGMYSAADCDNIDVSCSEAVMHNMGTFTRHINTTLTSVSLSLIVFMSDHAEILHLHCNCYANYA